MDIDPLLARDTWKVLLSILIAIIAYTGKSFHSTQKEQSKTIQALKLEVTALESEVTRLNQECQNLISANYSEIVSYGLVVNKLTHKIDELTKQSETVKLYELIKKNLIKEEQDKD